MLRNSCVNVGGSKGFRVSQYSLSSCSVLTSSMKRNGLTDKNYSNKCVIFPSTLKCIQVAARVVRVQSQRDDQVHGLRDSDEDELKSFLKYYQSKCQDESKGPGDVYLVGTGPGDPGLLTLRALQLMQAADVVLYDRLVSPEVLALVNKSARMVYVGKTSGFHTRNQDEIHLLLHAFAESGALVVRLKGGDPYVFGRGGEELHHLESNGVRVRCVPGITAASGICAELGVPMTHRGTATGVRFLTGHTKDMGEGGEMRKETRKGSSLNKTPLNDSSTDSSIYVAPLVSSSTSSSSFSSSSFSSSSSPTITSTPNATPTTPPPPPFDKELVKALAADAHTTLIIYMGLQTLPQLVSALLSGGGSPTLPAVAVERGTTPQRKVVFGEVGALHSLASQAGLKTPTLLVLGEVVALSPSWADWKEKGRPLLWRGFSEEATAGVEGGTTEEAELWGGRGGGRGHREGGGGDDGDGDNQPKKLENEGGQAKKRRKEKKKQQEQQQELNLPSPSTVASDNPPLLPDVSIALAPGSRGPSGDSAFEASRCPSVVFLPPHVTDLWTRASDVEALVAAHPETAAAAAAAMWALSPSAKPPIPSTKPSTPKGQTASMPTTTAMPTTNLPPKASASKADSNNGPRHQNFPPLVFRQEEDGLVLVTKGTRRACGGFFSPSTIARVARAAAEAAAEAEAGTNTAVTRKTATAAPTEVTGARKSEKKRKDEGKTESGGYQNSSIGRKGCNCP